MAKKISLSMHERFYFQSLMLANGDIKDMKIVRMLIDKVRITPKEADECELRILPNGSLKSNEKAKSKEFTFEEMELLYIYAGVDQAENNKKITLNNVDLAERFKGIKLTPKEKEK